jgi:UDP-perosamine 4-acetyltransferase
MRKRSILVLGGGGHSKVLIDSLRFIDDIEIKGILDVNSALRGKYILGVPVMGGEDEVLTKYPPDTVKLVNGIGSTGSTDMRKNIFHKFKTEGYHFLSVIHPTAYIGEDVVLGEGVQLMAGSIVQPSCRIGDNVIINTRASVDHDSHINHHAHIAPGAICCGNVTIGTGTHVGCGAVIREGIRINENCIIAAGAVVIHNIINRCKVAGVPAKIME